MQAHDSDGSESQIIDSLYMNIDEDNGLMPGQNFTTPRRVNSYIRYFATMLSFRVVCTDENYCGKDCTTPCPTCEQEFYIRLYMYALMVLDI